MFPMEMSRSRSWWNRTLPLAAQTTVCGLSRIAVKVEIKSNFGGEWFDPRTPSSPCTCTIAKFHLTEHHSRNLTHLCLADTYKLNQVLALKKEKLQYTLIGCPTQTKWFGSYVKPSVLKSPLIILVIS